MLRYCADLVQTSYSKANEAISHFVYVADNKLMTLERHLMLKQFEQYCDYVSTFHVMNVYEKITFSILCNLINPNALGNTLHSFEYIACRDNS